MTEDELLGYACEQFLGKSVVEIKSVILQTLEGHLRAILGGYTCSFSKLRSHLKNVFSLKVHMRMRIILQDLLVHPLGSVDYCAKCPHV